jgi:hypothetical protein
MINTEEIPRPARAGLGMTRESVKGGGKKRITVNIRGMKKVLQGGSIKATGI